MSTCPAPAESEGVSVSEGVMLATTRSNLVRKPKGRIAPVKGKSIQDSKRDVLVHGNRCLAVERNGRDARTQANQTHATRLKVLSI